MRNWALFHLCICRVKTVNSVLMVLPVVWVGERRRKIAYTWAALPDLGCASRIRAFAQVGHSPWRNKVYLWASGSCRKKLGKVGIPSGTGKLRDKIVFSADPGEAVAQGMYWATIFSTIVAASSFCLLTHNSRINPRQIRKISSNATRTRNKSLT